MTRPTPNRTQLRELAEQVVRHVAAGTGLTTIVTIGISADGVPVVTIDRFGQQQLDASYERLLTTTADLVREHPSGTPASSCALILPDRDVAYLHHHDTGNRMSHVLAVGRNPIDLPTTGLEVSRGLAVLMQALTDTQPSRPAAATAFLANPTARIELLPPPSRPTPPSPSGPEHRGTHR